MDKPIQITCDKCKKGMPIFVNLIEGIVSADCRKCGHRNVIIVGKKEKESTQVEQHI